MNSKYVQQRCGKHEIRKTGYAVALQVGENPMSAETWSADSIVIGLYGGRPVCNALNVIVASLNRYAIQPEASEAVWGVQRKKGKHVNADRLQL